mgnify:CR=1 FL=1
MSENLLQLCYIAKLQNNIISSPNEVLKFNQSWVMIEDQSRR